MPPYPVFIRAGRRTSVWAGFDTPHHIAVKYDSMLRFLGSGIQVAYAPHVAVKMCLGGENNRSLKNIFHKSIENYRALKATRIGALSALVWKKLSKLPQFLRRRRA